MSSAPNPGLDVSEQHWALLVTLLHRYLPKDCPVWAFGSRIKGTARANSDLDLVAFAPPDAGRTVAELREALEESNLPFRVDLLVWSELPESFQTEIERNHLPIFGVGAFALED